MITNPCEGDFEIVLGDVERPDVVELLEASEVLSRRLYPPESIHTLNRGLLAADNVSFFVAQTSSQVAIGCGAFVTDDASCAEIKRVFVAESHRRRGVAIAIMIELERQAIALNVTQLQLETGVSQPEAVGLYEALGFAECGPFGRYQADPLSLFYKKAISEQTVLKRGCRENTNLKGERRCSNYSQ